MKKKLFQSLPCFIATLPLLGFLLWSPLSFSAPISVPTMTSSGTLGSSGGNKGLQNLKDGVFTSGSYQEWLGAGSVTLDMGSVKTVDRLIAVGSSSTSGPAPLKGSVEVSVDGITWIKVKEYDNTGAAAGSSVLALGFGAQQARYVRFNMDSPEVNAQLSEIQLFNGEGPRVSLVNAGNWHAANEGAGRTPYNLVDRNLATFGLYAVAQTSVTLRLDSVEYDNGWNAITFGVRSFPLENGGANNPQDVTIYIGDGAGGWTKISSKFYDPVGEPTQFLVELDRTYTENLIKIEFSAPSSPTGVKRVNLQFTEFDVLPIPEPSLVGVTAVAAIALAGYRHRRRR